MRPAELILTGGTLFGTRGAQPAADSVVVDDGRIVAVTTAQDAASHRGPATRVIELDGRLCLPGFYDAHLHPLAAGLLTGWCDLREAVDAADCLDRIGRYAADHPELPWIIGGGWWSGSFPSGPTAPLLDGVVGDRPAYLVGSDMHDAWVNSAALRIAGVDRDTPDPELGSITRDESGAPTGYLHESAAELLRPYLPPIAPGDLEAALLAAQDELHRLGITGWQDALVGSYLGLPDPLPVYIALAQSGDLTANVSLALWWDPAAGLDQIDELLRRRAAAHAAGLRADHVKIMQDGICENGWATLLQPYANGSHRRTGRLGRDELHRAVQALAAEHFSVHFHAVGDAAVRDCLDAVQESGVANGGLRHQIAHLQLVDAADLPRFAELDVTAVIQPLWATETPGNREQVLPLIGPDRFSRQYQFASMLGAGARLAGSSDWPISSPNPLLAAHVATTRLPAVSSAPWLADAGPLTPLDRRQRLSAEEVLNAYTAQAAHAAGLDGAGHLEAGGRADIIVLDTDVVAAPELFEQARVDLTIAGGLVVHDGSARAR